jgi:maltodextrin utilization protein YvdJ
MENLISKLSSNKEVLESIQKLYYDYAHQYINIMINTISIIVVLLVFISIILLYIIYKLDKISSKNI